MLSQIGRYLTFVMVVVIYVAYFTNLVDFAVIST